MSRQAYAEAVTYTDEEGGSLKAANSAEVSVFNAGTETLAKLYEARSGGALLSNPMILGSTAMLYFWADTGDYDILVHDTKGPARFGDFTVGWQSSPPNPEIEAGDLSNEGDIEWTQELSGAWVPQLKENSVTANEIATGAVRATEIAADAVGAFQIAPSAVGAFELATSAVEEAKIKNLAVTDAKLAKPIITGSLTETGSVGNGTGFTAEKVETGVYKITLNSELPSLAEMMVTLHFVGGFYYLEAPSKKVFVVKTYDTNTIAKDIAFGFMIKAS